MFARFARWVHVELFYLDERSLAMKEFAFHLATVASFCATLGALALTCVLLMVAVMAQSLAIHFETALVAVGIIPLSMMPSILRRQKMKAIAQVTQ